MYIFTLFVILFTSFYFYLKSIFKKRNKEESALIIKEKKVEEEVFLDSPSQIKKTIPLWIYREEEGTSIFITEDENTLTLNTSFWVEEGEVTLNYKGIRIVKGAGEVVLYSLKNFSPNCPPISFTTTKGTKIHPFPSPNKYVLFAYLRKKCIEIACLYFNFTKFFVNREKEVQREEPEEINNRISKILKIKQDEEFREEIRFRVLEKEEILKKEGEYFDSLIYIHYGEIKVKVNGEEFYFGEKRIFGYFNLFFKIYKSIEIKASKKTKIQMYDYTSLKKKGFREEEIDTNLLKDLPDFVHLVDLNCDWRVYSPGTVLLREGEKPTTFYFVLEGKIREGSIREGNKEFVSGSTIGCRECLVGEEIKNKIITTRISDIVRIPKGLVEDFIGMNPSPLELARIFYSIKERVPGKIVTILPTDTEANILLFTRRLKASIGNRSLLLNTKDITEILSKRAFGASEELRLADYLQRVAQSYSVVLLHLENKYSRFLQYLLKVSDSCLITGRSPNSCPKRVLALERFCDLEYVTLYEDNKKIQGEKEKSKIEINRVHHILSPSRTILFDNKDFERLGRFLLGKRVGLVLSGGGARGIAHIGVVQALEEEGIPIDIVGGTSMGSFIGALYARDCDNGHVFRDTKRFCDKAKRILPFLLDLTYPFCSIFSGRTLNNTLKGIFKNQNIQDLWIEYFCITTNLFSNDEEVHRSGLIWKYVRASMGICGYLPPVCDRGGLLVDGGYLNNVPADVMLNMGVSLVIAVDVGTVVNNDYDPYEEHFNGFVGLLHRYFKTRKYLTMEEIQYRIAFLTTEKKIKELENNSSVLMIKPDLGDIRTGDFKRFDEIVAQGYQSAKKKIKEWKASGVYEKYFKNDELKKNRRRYSV